MSLHQCMHLRCDFRSIINKSSYYDEGNLFATTVPSAASPDFNTRHSSTRNTNAAAAVVEKPPDLIP